MAVTSLRDRYYPRTVYDRFSAISRVLELVEPHHRVLEIGCGDGKRSPDLRGRVLQYVGIDPDPGAKANPKLDYVHTGTADQLPWPDGSFDIALHFMVAEHLADPVAVMRETARVLKPSGVLVFETPNLWHYSSLVSKVTPHWFHEWVASRTSDRAAGDVFPTYYRCNSARPIKRILETAGLAGQITHVRMPPNYLSLHPVLFALGIAYERTVERVLPMLRARLLVEARKL